MPTILRWLSLVAFACMLCGASVAAASELECRVEGGVGTIGRRDSFTGLFSAASAKSLLRPLQRSQSKIAQRLRILKSQLRALKGLRGALIAAQRARIRSAIRSDAQRLSSLRATLRGISLCKNASLDALPPGITTRFVLPELLIDAGRTVNVPGTLWIESTGDVSINGNLLAQGAAGQSIIVESSGPIHVAGKIIAGTGPQGLAIDSARTSFSGEAGSDGGAVRLRSRQITLQGSARLVGGAGGSGRTLTAVLNETQGAKRTRLLNLEAGRGGTGGDIVLDAGDGELHIEPSPDGQPVLVVGNGGGGGNVRVSSVGTKLAVKEIAAAAGAGGSSGIPRLVAGTLSGLTFTETQLAGPVFLGSRQVMPAGGRLLNLDLASSSIFGGGIGGSGGEATIGRTPSALFAASAPESLIPAQRDSADPMLVGRVAFATAESGDSCQKPNGTRGRDCTPAKGARGGDGFFCPGDGGGVTCNDELRHGKGTEAGGAAVVEGGDGGNLRTLLSLSTTLLSDQAEFGLGLNISAIVSINSYCGRGGIGGLAQAYGGNGGKLGGSGGAATATGGNGGNAHFTPNGADINLTATVGGRGGNADAFGGNGMPGASCCTPERKSGQDGGAGGAALARGGDGGDGTYLQTVGSARARSGNAGAGGDGDGPGSAGQVGQVQAQVGNIGNGLITITEAPSRVEDSGSGASDGNLCPSTGPVPTPTSPGTSPGQCALGKYNGNGGCGFGKFEIFENRNSGQVRTGALGSGSTQVQFLCEVAPDCPCLVSGITIFNVEDHACCVRCQSGVITVSCRNPQGGTCVEQFQHQ